MIATERIWSTRPAAVSEGHPGGSVEIELGCDASHDEVFSPGERGYPNSSAPGSSSVRKKGSKRGLDTAGRVATHERNASIPPEAAARPRRVAPRARNWHSWPRRPDWMAGSRECPRLEPNGAEQPHESRRRTGGVSRYLEDFMSALRLPARAVRARSVRRGERGFTTTLPAGRVSRSTGRAPLIDGGPVS